MSAAVVVASTFGTVLRIIATRPGVWWSAMEVKELIPTEFHDQFSLSAIRSEFGAMHDMGIATRAGDRARWDA